MNIVRSIAAVIVGYLIFAFADMALVLGLFDQGLVTSPLIQKLAGLIGLLMIGFIVGFTVAKISGAYKRASIVIVVILIGAMTVLNIVLDQAIEPLWFKVLVLIVCAPAAVWSMRQN
ncbi:MAG: hypothetical protein DHS20C05_18020 [Hyphococcus sp.]|nr:MAG: hypothetical protein DHS20C05_18020 [Marinicaulis sp.]